MILLPNANLEHYRGSGHYDAFVKWLDLRAVRTADGFLVPNDKYNAAKGILVTGVYAEPSTVPATKKGCGCTRSSGGKRQ